MAAPRATTEGPPHAPFMIEAAALGELVDVVVAEEERVLMIRVVAGPEEEVGVLGPELVAEGVPDDDPEGVVDEPLLVDVVLAETVPV